MCLYCTDVTFKGTLFPRAPNKRIYRYPTIFLPPSPSICLLSGTFPLAFSHRVSTTFPVFPSTPLYSLISLTSPRHTPLQTPQSPFVRIHSTFVYLLEIVCLLLGRFAPRFSRSFRFSLVKKNSRRRKECAVWAKDEKSREKEREREIFLRTSSHELSKRSSYSRLSILENASLPRCRETTAYVLDPNVGEMVRKWNPGSRGTTLGSFTGG